MPHALTKKVLLAALAFVLTAVPIAAFAGSSTTAESPGPETPIAPDNALSAEELQIRADASSPVVGNQIPDAPVQPELAELCAERLSKAPGDIPCRAVIATDEGQLPPGTYTDSELERTLEEIDHAK